MVLPKHLNENRLAKAIELRQGFPALGAESIGLVEDGGDAALFGEWGEIYGKRLEVMLSIPSSAFIPA
jgi:hypothetical protein